MDLSLSKGVGMFEGGECPPMISHKKTATPKNVAVKNCEILTDKLVFSAIRARSNQLSKMVV